MLSLWSEHSCLTRQEIKDYIESIQRQDVTTEGGQSATTVVTAMEEFGPILDVDEPGIIEQKVGERDSATETMQSVTSEEGQSTTDATSERTTTDVSFLYGEEEEEKRPDAVVKGGEGRTINAVTMEPATTSGTATHAAATISPTVTMSRAAYGGEEEEKRLNAVVKGGEVRTISAVTMRPTTASGTATYAAATIDPAVTTAKTAWMHGSAISEIEIPARSKRSMDQHSMLIFFSTLLAMASIGLTLCILSCGVGLARGALHIRISERDEV